MAKILIVDDNPGNRSLLVEILGSCGHTIREASDGGEALALVSAERPDLVITDILMPTMDGYEFVRRLRSVAEIAHTPVMFWTAVFRERDARDLARECGVEYTLSKPCTDEIVRQTVEACLHKTVLPVPVTENFDRDHLRLVMDKLTKQAIEMAAVNSQLDALLEASLRLASETEPSRLLDEFCKSARHLVAAKFGMVGIVGEHGNQAYIAGVSSEAYPGLKDITRVHAVMAGLLSGQQPVRARNTSAGSWQIWLSCGLSDLWLAAGCAHRLTPPTLRLAMSFSSAGRGGIHRRRCAPDGHTGRTSRPNLREPQALRDCSVPKDGSTGSTGGRHGARFQQRAERHRRILEDAAGKF